MSTLNQSDFTRQVEAIVGVTSDSGSLSILQEVVEKNNELTSLPVERILDFLNDSRYSTSVDFVIRRWIESTELKNELLGEDFKPNALNIPWDDETIKTAVEGLKKRRKAAGIESEMNWEYYLKPGADIKNHSLLFKIAFTLGMDAAMVKRLMCINNNGGSNYNFRKVDEIIAFFCQSLPQFNKYSIFMDLCERAKTASADKPPKASKGSAPKADGRPFSSRAIESAYTKTIDKSVNGLLEVELDSSSDEEKLERLVTLIKEQHEATQGYPPISQTARKTVLSMLDDLQRLYGVYFIVDDILEFEKKSKKDKKPKEDEKLILENSSGQIPQGDITRLLHAILSPLVEIRTTGVGTIAEVENVEGVPKSINNAFTQLRDDLYGVLRGNGAVTRRNVLLLGFLLMSEYMSLCGDDGSAAQAENLTTLNDDAKRRLKECAGAGGDNADRLKKRLINFEYIINDFLISCGFESLYIPDPLDRLFVCAFLADDPAHDGLAEIFESAAFSEPR